MGAHKGQNNFKTMQRTKVESNLRLIAHVLSSIKKGTIFANENALIVYVAEKSGLHRTTIKRNPGYLSKVLNHLGTQPGAVGFVNDEAANVATLRAKLIAEKVKVKNLESEKARLIKAVERLSNTQITSEHAARMVSIEDISKAHLTVLDVAFTNTAMTLFILLEHLGEKDLGIILDTDKRQILDITEVNTKKIIAGPQRINWFFDWLVTQKLLRKLKAEDFKTSSHLNKSGIGVTGVGLVSDRSAND